MSSRPRHEALRGLVTELLREGFGATFSELEHERYLVDNSGRIDVAWGATVIELKTDLRREERDVVARMPDYLADASRRSAPGRTTSGLLPTARRCSPRRSIAARSCGSAATRSRSSTPNAAELARAAAVACSEVMPTPIGVAMTFGRYSLAFGRAHAGLQRLWSEVGGHPKCD